MSVAQVMYEEELTQMQTIVDRLVRESTSKVVFVIDRNGQLISSSGETDEFDTTSLASLTAGTIAATDGIAKLLRENEFVSQFHQGEETSISIVPVARRVILVVIYDFRTTPGMVKLRCKKATDDITKLFEAMDAKSKSANQRSPFSEITDDDIDNLFND